MSRARRRTASRRSGDPRVASRRLARQQQTIRVLLAQRGHPIAVDQLARELGVSERTVERDLERMREARLPLRGRGGLGGGVWLDVSRQPAPLALDHEQVMVLLVALDSFAELPDGLQSTRDDLRRRLADPQLF